MDRTRSLGRNTFYSGLSAGSNVLLVVLVVLAANKLGDRQFGRFSFALAIASIFEMLIDLGLNTLIARDVARNRRLAAVYLPNVLGWKLLLSVVAMGLLVVTVNLLQHDQGARAAAYILGVAIVLRSFMATSHAFFQSHERFDLVLLTTYVERVLVFALGLGALYVIGGLIPFCMIFLFARLPDLILSYWLIGRHITPLRITADPAVIRGMQRQALPFASYTVIAVLYVSTGTVVLSSLRPPEEVGWYNAGYKIYEGLTMIPVFVGAVMLPRLSRLFVADRERHEYLAQRSLKYLAITVFPIAALTAYVSGGAIRILFGAEYLPAVIPLKILIGASVFMCMNLILNTILVSADLQAAAVRIAACALAIMMFTNLLLIPYFHVIGAAACVGISEASVLLMVLGAMRRKLFAAPVHLYALRPAVSCGLAGLFVHQLHLGTAASVLVFSLLYVLTLLALRPFDVGEWAELRKVFRPRVSSAPSD